MFMMSVMYAYILGITYFLFTIVFTLTESSSQRGLDLRLVHEGGARRKFSEDMFKGLFALGEILFDLPKKKCQVY